MSKRDFSQNRPSAKFGGRHGITTSVSWQRPRKRYARDDEAERVPSTNVMNVPNTSNAASALRVREGKGAAPVRYICSRRIIEET